MTHEDRDQDFELQQLFDRTAGEASGPTLTKLGARAADVPRLARKSRSLPRWRWAPLFGAAACAVLALALVTRRTHPSGQAELASTGVTPTPRAATAAPGMIPPNPEVGMAVASASSTELGGAAPHTNAGEEGDNLDLLGDADEGARFEVSGPQSDRDLDAWLAATKELSGGT